MLIVQLEDGVYLADDGQGDPPRTLKPENAKKFKTVSEAVQAISDARKFRLFKNAKPVKLTIMK